VEPARSARTAAAIQKKKKIKKGFGTSSTLNPSSSIAPIDNSILRPWVTGFLGLGAKRQSGTGLGPKKQKTCHLPQIVHM
jgi:hypothetical protein